mmetsp:Transcript_107360/g.309057  ORF Transcript_107360/g.309057 Transcript_107360/m.309057 type:complete len:370 (-) Transcript_107360:457-1566(-)
MFLRLGPQAFQLLQLSGGTGELLLEVRNADMRPLQTAPLVVGLQRKGLQALLLLARPGAELLDLVHACLHLLELADSRLLLPLMCLRKAQLLRDVFEFSGLHLGKPLLLLMRLPEAADLGGLLLQPRAGGIELVRLDLELRGLLQDPLHAGLQLFACLCQFELGCGQVFALLLRRCLLGLRALHNFAVLPGKFLHARGMQCALPLLLVEASANILQLGGELLGLARLQTRCLLVLADEFLRAVQLPNELVQALLLLLGCDLLLHEQRAEVLQCERLRLELGLLGLRRLLHGLQIAPRARQQPPLLLRLGLNLLQLCAKHLKISCSASRHACLLAQCRPHLFEFALLRVDLPGALGDGGFAAVHLVAHLG